MTKAEYIDTNAKWMGKSTAAALEQVPETHWPALIAAMTIYGGTDPGIDCEVVATRETLADFDIARQDHWSERGGRTEHTVDGRSALLFERFQIARGKTRQNMMVVIDFGDLRIALQ